MAYIQIHQSLLTHRKVFRLARLLGISRPQAVGHLVALWTWAIDNAPDGVLTLEDVGALADVCESDAPPDAFGAALHESGFLDLAGADYALHDWGEYAGTLIDRRRAHAERMCRARATRGDGAGRARDAHVLGTCGARDTHVPGTCSPRARAGRVEQSNQENPPPVPPPPPPAGEGGRPPGDQDGDGDAGGFALEGPDEAPATRRGYPPAFEAIWTDALPGMRRGTKAKAFAAWLRCTGRRAPPDTAGTAAEVAEALAHYRRFLELTDYPAKRLEFWLTDGWRYFLGPDWEPAAHDVARKRRGTREPQKIRENIRHDDYARFVEHV